MIVSYRQTHPEPLKAFYDFEFTGLHQQTTPISLGISYSNGYRLYAEFTDYDRTQADDWIQKNVINRLVLGSMPKNNIRLDSDNRIINIRGTREFIAKEIVHYQEHIYPHLYDLPIEMWGDCSAYDWMLLCQLYGGAMELPKCFYYIPFDIVTLMKIKGVDPDVTREEFIRSEIPEGSFLESVNVFS